MRQANLFFIPFFAAYLSFNPLGFLFHVWAAIGCADLVVPKAIYNFSLLITLKQGDKFFRAWHKPSSKASMVINYFSGLKLYFDH